MLTVNEPRVDDDRAVRHLVGRVGIAAFTAALLVSCSATPDPTPAPAVAQMEYRVGGLPVVEGPSGVRDDAPPPRRKAAYSDGHAVDTLVLSAVDDVEMFWQQAYPASFGARFDPVDELVSYDSLDPSSPEVCGNRDL